MEEGSREWALGSDHESNNRFGIMRQKPDTVNEK